MLSNDLPCPNIWLQVPQSAATPRLTKNFPFWYSDSCNEGNVCHRRVLWGILLLSANIIIRQSLSMIMGDVVEIYLTCRVADEVEELSPTWFELNWCSPCSFNWSSYKDGVQRLWSIRPSPLTANRCFRFVIVMAFRVKPVVKNIIFKSILYYYPLSYAQTLWENTNSMREHKCLLFVIIKCVTHICSKSKVKYLSHYLKNFSHLEHNDHVKKERFTKRYWFFFTIRFT